MISLVTGPSVEPIGPSEARRQLQLTLVTGEPCPTVPTLALASPAAPGNCDAGVWRVGITHVTADGETELGPLSAGVTVANAAVNGQLAVSAISIGGANVTSRKVYAVPPAGGVAKYVATISNNSATTYTVNIAAASLTGASAPTTNTTEDPDILDLIKQVRGRGEDATHRAFLTQTWDLVMDGFPEDGDDVIEIPLPPLQSVTSVTYLDMLGATQTMSSSLYRVEAPAGPHAQPGKLSLVYGEVWPLVLGERSVVTIRFVCGYGATAASVPPALRAAMKLDLGTLWMNREGIIMGGRDAAPDELPQGVAATYFSYRAHPSRRLMRQVSA